jgi:hypothetical protein
LTDDFLENEAGRICKEKKGKGSRGGFWWEKFGE